MLNIVDINTPIQEVETPFKFPLDPFQKHAIYAISKDENVLVTAKTGSGKTLVGEYQIHHSLSKGKRVFYTTPIKSLSNQKFHDLKQMFPSVGIMTGDIKFMPQADVVIMTTEILRNLLFKVGTTTESVGVTANLSLNNLDAVVFDEVHYINDFDRGKVWEECLALLPREVNLVLLSATIERPEKFANWIGNIKQKPIHLISTEYRVVPLSHQLPDKTVVMDSRDKFDKKVYANWVNRFYERQDEQLKHKERVAAREEGENVVKRGEHETSFVDRMNKLIEYSIDLPALFFVFSRRMCVELAKKVSSNLIDSSDSASVRHIVNFHLHRYPHLETSQQYHELKSLLEKGVAYHHSGLLPVLKEIVEILFGRGFIKVLFATETFAVGINMPTKTVVFTSYRKYDDISDKHRMLTPSEYTQMAGRAGRRGKDDKGIVVYLPLREPEAPFLVEEMMIGKKSELTSRMDFHYSYILASLQSGKNIIEETFWATEMKDQVHDLDKRIELKQKQIVEFDDFTRQELMKRVEFEEKFASSSNSERKKWQAELGRWNNSHVGPKWDTAWKSFKIASISKNEIEYLIQQKEKLLDFEFIINKRKDVLRTNGFMTNNTLTYLGVLASEIHEGHPILMSCAFAINLIHKKSAEEIVECLTVFLEDVESDDPIPKIEFHKVLDEYAKRFAESEVLKSDLSFWKLTSYWTEVVREWMNGNDFVCEQFGIDQGNFVRAILKLSNIVEEWMNMATIMQDVEMIEKMKDVKNNIIRGFVVPDSLYLRI
jgi:superfamily II RNA helicase